MKRAKVAKVGQRNPRLQATLSTGHLAPHIKFPPKHIMLYKKKRGKIYYVKFEKCTQSDQGWLLVSSALQILYYILTCFDDNKQVFIAKVSPNFENSFCEKVTNLDNILQ